MSNENNNLQTEAVKTTPAPTTTLPAPAPLLKVATTGRDMIFALLFLVAGIIWIDFSLYGGFDLGYTIASIILGALVLIYPTAEHRLSLFGTLYATCAVAITVPFCMYTSVSAKVLLFFWSLLLMGLAIANNTKNASRGWMQLGEAMRLVLMTPFERCSNTLASLFQDKGSNSKKKAQLSKPKFSQVLPLSSQWRISWPLTPLTWAASPAQPPAQSSQALPSLLQSQLFAWRFLQITRLLLPPEWA